MSAVLNVYGSDVWEYIFEKKNELETIAVLRIQKWVRKQFGKFRYRANAWAIYEYQSDNFWKGLCPESKFYLFCHTLVFEKFSHR